MTAEHFDAVVVGSGFGGAVCAYRLAEAQRSVCVLERGKPYPPNSFPRAPHRMKANFWDPSKGLHGMFDIWSFSGIDVIVSSGLGGGSLIYANVLIRKDERWFVQEDLERGGYEHWPVTRADLEPHYDRAEAMLGAQTYPFHAPPYSGTTKTQAFKEAAETVGADWFLPNLAVTFANAGKPPVPGERIEEEHRNLHDRDRTTCRLCGECDIGCNFGSKNTLDYNYLSAAKRLGAELRTRCEVRTFRALERGGYEIDYVEHPAEEEGKPLDTHDPHNRPIRTITADRLVLSAGTLGSTFLLLKNQRELGGLSPRLGAGFSGNGDLLTFAARASRRVGGRRRIRVIDAGHGPVITSAVRYPDALDDEVSGRGFYLQDAGYPQFVAWLHQSLDVPSALWRLRRIALGRVLGWLREERDTNLSAEVGALLGGRGRAASLLPLLGMGRDIPDGRLSLRDERTLENDWHKERSSAYFDRVRHESRRLAEALGARFMDNPTWNLSRLVTVHPLGGCPMGRNSQEGVVDSHGEVFGHPGLYVADGSVMPGPVGPNPSLTIAALADRFADRLVEPRSTRR